MIKQRAVALGYANVRPFLRWAGSKRRLLKYVLPYVPRSVGTYFEPFLGGGALFFFIGPARAEISDVSSRLIQIYVSVGESPEEILNFLRPLKPTKRNFDLVKAMTPVSGFELAAQMIFLNKTCWNGLYRVNSEGIFNVPFGQPKTNFLVDEANFRNCARQLRRRGVVVRHQDFEGIEPRVSAGDFVYFDPPYVTSHNRNGFADWNEKLFSWSDQKRLARLATSLAARGANVLVSNADHEDVRSLYSDFFSARFERFSTLASKSTKRTMTSEALFFAGPWYEKNVLAANIETALGNDCER